MRKRRLFIHEKFWLIGIFCLTLTSFVLSACRNEAAQPVPTLVPAADVGAEVANNAVVTAVSVPLVPTYTPEPVEVVVNNEQTVMTLWHSWTDGNAAALAELVTRYEVGNPTVKVSLVYQANMMDALKTAVPVGEGPDLILMTQDQLGRFAEAGYIAPMTADFDTGYLAETFSPAAAAAMTWQDDVWGVPALQDSIAIIYNKSLLDENLIPADVTDFDALLNNAIAYHEANPTSYMLCNQSLSPDSLDVYHTAPIFFGFGGLEERGYLDDWGNVFVNTPERVAAGEWLLNFMQAAPPEAGYEICQAGFLAGEIASWWTGSWALDNLDVDFEMGVRPFGRPFTHVTGFFLGTNAVDRNHQTLAADVMSYFASPDVQTELALVAHIAPANQQALTSEAVQAQPNMAAFGAAAANGIPFPASPFADVQWQPLGQATSNMLNNRQSPAEALQEAETAVIESIETLKNQ